MEQHACNMVDIYMPFWVQIVLTFRGWIQC